MRDHDGAYDMPPEPPQLDEPFPSTPPQRRSYGQQQSRPYERNNNALARKVDFAVVQHDDQVNIDERGHWQMRNEAEQMAIINRLRAAQAIPKTFENSDQVAYAMQILKKRGLDPMVCIGDTGFINGKFVLYNDAPLAIAQRTGELEHFEEYTYAIDKDGVYKKRSFANQNLHLKAAGAVCVIKRRGWPLQEFSWTVEEAKDANQLGKPGPWKTDLAGMMKYKARARALKSQFAAALAGGEDLPIAVHAEDVHDAHIIEGGAS